MIKKDLLLELSKLIEYEMPIFIGSKGQEKQFLEDMKKISRVKEINNDTM